MTDTGSLRPEFPPPTVVRWVNYETINTDKLAAEMRMWLDILNPHHEPSGAYVRINGLYASDIHFVPEGTDIEDSRLVSLWGLVAMQAEDPDLWRTPSDAFPGVAKLQRALRDLHSLIEEIFGPTWTTSSPPPPSSSTSTPAPPPPPPTSDSPPSAPSSASSPLTPTSPPTPPPTSHRWDDDMGPCAAGEHCLYPGEPVQRGLSVTTMLYREDAGFSYIGRFHLNCEDAVPPPTSSSASTTPPTPPPTSSSSSLPSPPPPSASASTPTPAPPPTFP